MKNFEQLNASCRTIKEGIVLENLEFKPLKEFVGRTLNVDGFFFTTGNYGEQVVVVANGYKINMPGRAVSQFKDISAEEELLKLMFDGHFAIENIKEVKTKNGTTTGYTFVTK